MPAMVDANVVIHLTSPEPDDADLKDQWTRCRELAAKEGTLWISALVWFEACRRLGGAASTSQLEKLAKHYVIEPFDVAVAEHATTLLPKQSLCPKCYSHADEKTCTECGKAISKALRLNDSLVVAHADVLSLITHLYTFDSGMLKLGKVTRADLSIAEPPAATGAPIVKRGNKLTTPPQAVPAPTDGASTSTSIPIPMALSDSETVSAAATFDEPHGAEPTALSLARARALSQPSPSPSARAARDRRAPASAGVRRR